jgi:nucleoside-diphosphate-sugar epimerase
VCLYAASKKAFEAVLRYYQELFKIKAVTLKLHDTYGASDRRSKLFTTLRKHGENTVLPMSAGDQKLDLVYIDDVVDAYIVAAHRLLSRKNSDLEEFAVSSGNQVSLRDIVELYAQITKKKMRIDWGKRPYRLREVMVPWTKGSSLPGWEPKISLSEGIMRMHEHDRHSHMDERHSESFFREIY